MEEFTAITSQISARNILIGSLLVLSVITLIWAARAYPKPVEITYWVTSEAIMMVTVTMAIAITLVIIVTALTIFLPFYMVATNLESRRPPSSRTLHF